jgi:hypothetical protein
VCENINYEWEILRCLIMLVQYLSIAAIEQVSGISEDYLAKGESDMWKSVKGASL